MDKARLDLHCMAMDHLDATIRALAQLGKGPNPPAYAIRVLAQHAHRLHDVAGMLAQDDAYTPDDARRQLEALRATDVASVS